MNLEELTPDQFVKLQAYIYRHAGIRIGDHKRLLVSNRVRRRVRATGKKDFAEYLKLLYSPAGRDEITFFLNEITTNETYFFRDEHQYRWFQREFLQARVRESQHDTRLKSLKIWSAACSTGEEPYGLAMLLDETLQGHAGWRTSILATDLSTSALDKAKKGEFNDRAIHLVSPKHRQAYFRKPKEGQNWILADSIRSAVTFRNHNLLKPVVGGPFDCIFIKNVLIYFDDASKEVVVQHLLRALGPGGYLVVGPSEGIFRMLDALERKLPWLYQKPTLPRS